MHLQPPSTVQTMSSREIADLLGKAHSNIKISAERMQASGVIGTLAVQEFEHNGNTYTEYLLEKRDCLVLVAQNSPEYTARIVDRWQELEAAQSPKLPQTMAQALRLAADQAEQLEHQAAQLALAAPKVEYVDRYVAASGALGFRQVAKLLNANELEFRAWLQDTRVMYRLGGEWAAYQNHIDTGRFVTKAGVATRNEHAYSRTLFTPKGVNWIAGEWAKHQLALATTKEGSAC